jgi:hypothetical protein
MSWQRQKKRVFMLQMWTSFCSLHLQSTSEILEILRRAANTLHIQVERWDQRVSERSVGYVVFVLLILRGWQIYVETLFYCGVDKTQCTPHSRQSTKLSRQSSELGLPHPSHAGVLLPRPPPPPVPGRRAHSLAGEGVGRFQFHRGGIHCGTLGMYVLADRKFHVCHDYSIRRLGWNCTAFVNQQLTNNVSITWAGNTRAKRMPRAYSEKSRHPGCYSCNLYILCVPQSLSHVIRFTVTPNTYPPPFHRRSADYSQPPSDSFGNFLRRLSPQSKEVTRGPPELVQHFRL